MGYSNFGENPKEEERRLVAERCVVVGAQSEVLHRITVCPDGHTV